MDLLIEDTFALFFYVIFLQSDIFGFVLKMSFSCNHSLDGSFPPSPAEDNRGSQRLSWGSLLQRLTELKGISQRVTTDHQCSRSETGECCRLLSGSFVWVESHSTFFALLKRASID